MHVFAIAVLFGLGVMAIATWLDSFMPRAHRFNGIVMVVLGVLGAWFADFNLWKLWSIPVRADWIGLVLTGVAIGGAAYAWHEILGVLTSASRKTSDEAEALELSTGLRAA